LTAGPSRGVMFSVTLSAWTLCDESDVVQRGRPFRERRRALRKTIATKHVRDELRILRRGQRPGLVERHRPPHALEQIAERPIVPLSPELCAGQRRRIFAPAEIRLMTAGAPLEIDRFPLRSLGP